MLKDMMFLVFTDSRNYNLEHRFALNVGFVKFHTYWNFQRLLNLLSDTYLIFHIKINDDSCDLLFHTHFISLDPKHDSRHNS